MSNLIMKKFPVLVLLLALLFCVFSPSIELKTGLLDAKAALLVLVTPLLLVFLLQKQPLPFSLLKRVFFDERK
jgi:hypothetical protein